MPDQLAILIDFPDAMKGNLAYCTVGPSELEEKMVATEQGFDILQRNLDDFPAYAIMVTNHRGRRLTKASSQRIRLSRSWIGIIIFPVAIHF